MAEKPLLSFEQLMKDMEKLDMVEFKEKYGCEKPDLKGLMDKMWLNKLSSFQIQELENKVEEFGGPGSGRYPKGSGGNSDGGDSSDKLGKGTKADVKTCQNADEAAFKTIGATSGGQVRENPKLKEEYTTIIKEKLGTPKKQLTQEVHDKLEDENYHLLNETLAQNGYYPESIAKGYIGLSKSFSKSIKEVELFEPGHHNGKTFTDAEIDGIIESTNKMVKDQNLQIPIKLGHSKEQSVAKQIFGDDDKGLPALGWVKNLKKVGKKIVADLTDIPEKLYDLLKEKMWNTRSIELWEGFVSQAGKNVGSVITGLALLGAEQPAVTALATLFEQEGEVKTYSSESTEGEIKMAEEIKTQEAVVETPATPAVETVTPEVKKETEMSKEVETEKLREFKKKADEGALAIKELSEFKKQVRASEDNAFIDSLEKEGKLLPFQADMLKPVLVEIEDKAVKYFDKEIEEEVAGKSKELLKEFLKSLPNQIEYREFSKSNGKVAKDNVEVMVKDYQAKNPNVDIADAYKIVCRENNIDINTL